MIYKQLLYGDTPIPSQPEAAVLSQMQKYYCNFMKKEAFPYCGGESHLLFSSIGDRNA